MDGQELGRSALAELFRGLSTRTASEIVDGLVDYVAEESAELHPADDVSLIVMKMADDRDEMSPRRLSLGG